MHSSSQNLEETFKENHGNKSTMLFTKSLFMPMSLIYTMIKDLTLKQGLT